MSNRGWIGVDLDGTLAVYGKWQGPEHIGEPIDLMVRRVVAWLEADTIVKVFTARVSDPKEADVARAAIEAWCLQHIGRILEVTCSKDYGMIELWDDRCVQVVHNTGQAVRAP